MKRLISALLLTAMLISGCAPDTAPEKKQYTATFLTLFDTVTTIVGKADSQEAFTEEARKIHDALLEYHQLFDIYNTYEGLNNLKTVNDQAGIAPVEVDSRIIELLLDCKQYHAITDGMVNAAMGSVLTLWHDARSDSIDDPANARLPDETALHEAAAHVDFTRVEVDEAASTVYINDPLTRLDVGAIAKGWSVQRVCGEAPRGLLISVGGNVCATGPKDDSGAAWVVGVQNPDGGDSYLHTLNITGGSVVTSGDYQRAFAVDGQRYHHIIDPDTLYPSRYWRSVTVICDDSGLADALSTALFVCDQAQGQELLSRCGAEAMWVDAQGQQYYSDGFADYIRT